MIKIKKFIEKNKTTVIFPVESSTQDFLIDLLKNNYKKGARIYKDKNSCTFTFFEASSELDSLIISLCDMALSNEYTFSEIEVPGLIPIYANINDIKINEEKDIVFEDTILSSKFKYKDIKVSKALSLYKDDALIDLLSAKLDTNIADEYKILMAIKKFGKEFYDEQYGNLTKEVIFSLSKEQISDFIFKYSNVLNSKIKEILTKSTYQTLEDFVNNADNLLLGSAYRALVIELGKKIE